MCVEAQAFLEVDELKLMDAKLAILKAAQSCTGIINQATKTSGGFESLAEKDNEVQKYFVAVEEFEATVKKQQEIYHCWRSGCRKSRSLRSCPEFPSTSTSSALPSRRTLQSFCSLLARTSATLLGLCLVDDPGKKSLTRDHL